MDTQRRAERRQVGTRGWIDGGSERTPCLVLEISDKGAELAVKDAPNLPEKLRLYFSPTAQTFRLCVIRWRAEDTVGVEFERRDSNSR